MRWPSVVKPGQVINDTCSLQDMIPTFAAAAGEPDLVEKVKKGFKIGDKTFKVHLDGYNLLPFLKGEVDKSPRKGFLYWSDDGDLMALRVENWKIHFVEQRAHGFGVWKEPMVALRAPTIVNLRTDPFERGPEDASVFYDKWVADRSYLLVPAQAIVGEFLKTFQEFPPRAKAASFSIDQAMEKLMPKDSGGVAPKEETQEPKAKKSKAELAAHN
jgi:arylsulfatase